MLRESAVYRAPLSSRLFGGLLVLGVGAFGLGLLGNLIPCMTCAAPERGDSAPAFDVTAIDGPTISSLNLRGQVTLLDFWTTTCVGCIGATPKLNRLTARYQDQPFRLISFNQDADMPERVREVIEARNLKYPVILDDGDIADSFGVYAYPTVILLDDRGRIRAKHTGAVTEATLRREIEALLFGVSAENAPVL